MNTPQDDLAGLVMMTARRIRTTRMETLKPLGLTPHQARAFLMIARHHRHRRAHELRLTDLAHRLRIAPRSVTEVVDSLCERELVRRRPSPTDRRATMLVLTPKGADLNDDVIAAESLDSKSFAALSDSERDHLAILLRKIIDSELRRP